jgi:hypothetical protein
VDPGLGILLLAGLAQGAAADPINAKNSFTFPAACDGQTVQFVVNGNGAFTPGHVVGSTAVFVLQAFDITFQFTPTGGEPVTETDTQSKHNPNGTWLPAASMSPKPSRRGPSGYLERPRASSHRLRNHPRVAQSAEGVERLRPPRRRRFPVSSIAPISSREGQRAGRAICLPYGAVSGGVWWSLTVTRVTLTCAYSSIGERQHEW